MANQRIYIRCKVCGDEKFFAKRFGGAFRTVHKAGDWQDEWDAWFVQHEWGFCRRLDDLRVASFLHLQL